MTRFAAAGATGCLRSIFFCLASAACCVSAEIRKPRIVVSFLPLYCFTASVAGDRATVETLLTGAISPHDYHFSPQDMKKLGNADLLVTLGLEFEPWTKRLGGNAPSRIIEASAGIREQLIQGNCGHDHAGDAGHAAHAPNPHIWLDPQLAMTCVSNITEALRSVDPPNAAYYFSNAQAYIERLRSLDSYIAETLRPFRGTAVMTYHDALPYFTRRYDLAVAAVVQPSPEVNPSLRRIAELRRVVRDKNVKVLLVDANARSTLAERIGKEFRIPVTPFDNLETGDRLSPVRTGGPSLDAYENVMRSNANAIARALK